MCRGVYTTEKKWHGSDKNWNGSNSFCKETVNFYPFRFRSIGAYGPVAERIRVHSLSNEDMILALAGQFKQLSREPEKFR